jgi:hypothetical protein
MCAVLHGDSTIGSSIIDPAIMSCKVKQQPPGKSGALAIITQSDTPLPANENAAASSKLKALIGLATTTPELSPDNSGSRIHPEHALHCRRFSSIPSSR